MQNKLVSIVITTICYFKNQVQKYTLTTKKIYMNMYTGWNWNTRKFVTTLFL